MATLGIAMALGAGAARADEADDQRGRFHFQAGASYYEAGDYEHALREFERAYEVSKRPELNYNLSLAHQQLDHLDEAIEYLRRYLEEVEEIPNRTNLERRLENLRERAAEKEAPDDEADTGTDPDTTQGSPEEASTQDGFEGDVRTRPVDVDGASPDEGGGVPAAAWVGWGIGAGSLVTATALGIMALKEQSDVADSPCGVAGTCTQNDVDKMETLALLSDVFLGVGLAGAAVGTILFFTLRDGGGAEESASRARLELAPWVDPRGGAGATVGGNF
ncbi:MAG: tetratricopeptide repeat protein [Myxococcota bacterium]